MPAHFRFDRPDLDHWKAAPPLFVTGRLVGARPLLAYEGRLQIHNGVGDCVARLIDGVLPPGWSVYVDQATKQVVVAWPAYSSTVIPLANPGFESGATDGWEVTQIGGTGTPTASGARPYQGRFSGLWKGAAGTGHARGVEAIWANTVRPSVLPGQRISVSAQIALDDTSKSQNRGEVRLNWYNVAGELIGSPAGNLIRGNNSSYRLSSLAAAAPAGAASVSAAVWTTANWDGGTRFDAVQWDYPSILGTTEDKVWPLSIEVRDQAGRSVIWTGVISDQFIYFTTRPYGISAPTEGLVSAAPGIGAGRMFMGSYEDGERLIGRVPVFLGGELRTPLKTTAWEERIAVAAPVFASGTLRNVVKPYSTQEPLQAVAPVFASGTLKKLLLDTASQERISATAPRFLSGTLT